MSQGVTDVAGREAIALEQNFTLFISHPTEDKAVAKALQDALVDLDRLRVDVFVDQTEIPKGKSIGSYITASLDRANWFIAIGTDVVRSNFSWCGLELGYFTSVRRHKDKTSVTLLYHSQIHELFSDHNNTQVVPITKSHQSELPGPVCNISDTPLYKMFMDIAQSYVDFYPSQSTAAKAVSLSQKFEGWASESATAVTQSYFEALRQRVKDVWYPQNRLEIRIDDGNFWDTPSGAIPLDSVVEMDVPTFGIFRIAVPASPNRASMTWASFGNAVRRQCGGDNLLQIISEILRSVLPMGADAENDYTFVAPDHVRYRVLLVKHQRYGTNRRDFIINFVPTIRRDAGGDQATSQLTAAIMLGSKYWFMFLESNSPYTLAIFENTAKGRAFEALIKKMIRDVERVLLEAADEGLSDKDTLIELLGKADEVTEMFDVWWPSMDRLREEAARIAAGAENSDRSRFMEAHRSFTDISRTVNRDFIRLCLDAYGRRLG